jgi:hypothetical protein
MIRLIWSIFLCGLILSQPITKTWKVISFELNKAYIVDNLCIQKNEVENTCQGRCHLTQIKAESEGNENPQFPAGIKEMKELVFYSTTQLLPNSIVFSTDLDFTTVFVNEYSFSPQHDNWHPPKV